MKVIEIIHIMSEPMRFKIIELLLEDQHCVQELAKQLNISESAVSQHIKVLKKYYIVYGKRKGYQKYYQVDVEYLQVLFESINDWMKQYSCQETHYRDIVNQLKGDRSLKG